MRKTALLLASVLLYPTPAKAQAAAEAGMVTGAVSGLTSATSHKLGVSNLGTKTGGKVTEVTNTPRRTTPRHTRTATQKKPTPTTTASTAAHSTKPQSHIVSVWPPNALTQTQPQ